MADLSVRGLRCEHHINPIGIDTQQPRLSWLIDSNRRGVRQTAYQILVADSLEQLAAGAANRWDSGRVESDESLYRVYQGTPLASGQRCYWKVRVWDENGQPSDWSEAAFWEMGLLQPGDWQAEWISPAWDEDKTTSQPCPMLRSTFTVDGPVRSARVYVTSLGLHELAINGQRVGDQLFTPGWTSYNKRLHYHTYDVTGHLQTGANAVGAVLGDGWYRGNLAWIGRRNVYGDRLALLFQLRIDYQDGRVQVVSSGPGWKASTGPILWSDLYNGESYDARLEKPGWDQPGYDDGNWSAVTLLSQPKTHLVAPRGPAVRRIQEVRPIAILHTPAGETVVDMGQNMTGWVRLKVKGQAGTCVSLRHAEVLDQNGNFYTANLRAAQQRVEYTLKGVGEEVYEPHFSFQGFRYVQVEGYPGDLTLDSLTGVVIHSDTPPTGTFETSNPLINQLQHNIVWGQKGNFLDVPTDCPQRDERLGWTGDAQVFVRTACFNMDVAGFFAKWLQDLAADQEENGSVPHVVPNVLKGVLPPPMQTDGSSAWGDAAVICPWTIYLCYGDTRILEDQYDSMVGWIRYIQQEAGESLIWPGDWHFGDWLAIASPEPLFPTLVTEKDLIATAYFAYSTGIVAQAARILGKTDDARHYTDLAEAVKAAFCREFVTPNGRLTSNTQTAYVLALMFDLLPEAQRPDAARRLAEDIRKRDVHLSTGFVGTSYLPHVLSRFGYTDLAYGLLLQDTYPSWLYPVKQGATTIWERWDGIKPDGEFQSPSMNSFNHYAYGAIGEWMYRVVAGIEVDTDAPGYRHTLIQPQPGGGFTAIRATLDSRYGRVGSAWEQHNGQMRLTVTVPANTRASVRLPAARLESVTESGRPLAQADGITQAHQNGDQVIVEVGSGEYVFVYPIVG